LKHSRIPSLSHFVQGTSDVEVMRDNKSQSALTRRLPVGGPAQEFAITVAQPLTPLGNLLTGDTGFIARPLPKETSRVLPTSFRRRHRRATPNHILFADAAGAAEARAGAKAIFKASRVRTGGARRRPRSRLNRNLASRFDRHGFCCIGEGVDVNGLL
jgi:hypothetical protein